MLLDMYEIAFRQMAGEDIEDAERKRLKEYNARYALVRFLYLEKVNAEAKDGPEVTNFHFTPGDGFMEIPILDVVNELLGWTQAIKDGKVKPHSFGDSHWVDNPPKTGLTKTTLGTKR